jgi:hypothetical protein
MRGLAALGGISRPDTLVRSLTPEELVQNHPEQQGGKQCSLPQRPVDCGAALQRVSEAKMHATRRACDGAVAYVETSSARLCVRFTEGGQSQDIKAILLADHRPHRGQAMSEEFTSELSIQ